MYLCNSAAVFQPSPGGHITMTSRSEQLLQMLKPASPVAKVLLLSLQSHAHLYQDSGLFAALLSVESVITQLNPEPLCMHVHYVILQRKTLP